MVNEEKVKLRVLVRKIVTEYATLIEDEREAMGEVHGEQAVELFDKMLRERLYPSEKPAEETKPAHPNGAPHSVGRERRAYDILEEMETLYESGELPASGVEYAESVMDKGKSILETIERTDRVSDDQLTALTNMLEGLHNWFD